MSSPIIDAVFSNFNDKDLCNSWCKAYEARLTVTTEDLPVSTVIKNIWDLSGLWDNGGMALMLACGTDELNEFEYNLGLIGEYGAASWMKSALEEIGGVRLQDERYLLSDEFNHIAKDLDEDWRWYREGIPEALATFARVNRSEAFPFIEEIARIAAADRAERESRIRQLWKK